MLPHPPPLRPMRVSHGQIDFADTAFRLRHRLPDTPDEALESSVSRFGLLHPPILREGSSSRGFQIVAGRKRLLAAARLLDESSTNCLVLPPEVDDATCLAVACEDGILHGGLSPVERAVFAQKALDMVGMETAVSLFLPMAGLPSQPWRLEQAIGLLDLEEPLLDALQDGRLEENAARELGRLSFSDRMALFELIDTLSLSVSHQRKLIGLCRDLSKRSRQTILAILGSSAIEDIVNHPQANIPQKTTNLMHWLTGQSFPRYTEALARHQERCRNLNLPENAALSHALSFERDTLTLTLTFNGWEELSAAWTRIRMVLQGEDERPQPGHAPPQS